MTPGEPGVIAAPKAVCFSRSDFQDSAFDVAGGQELSTAAGGRRSLRTHDRRGGQLAFNADLSERSSSLARSKSGRFAPENTHK